MKIIYLHQYFVTPDMSGGTRSYEFARRLVKMGHDVHLVTSDCSGSHEASHIRKELIQGINVYWLSVPYNNSMGYLERLIAFMKFALWSSLVSAKIGGDIVFATSTPLTIAIPGIFCSLANKIPMVLEIRDMWPAVPISIGALKNPITKYAARLLEKFSYFWATHIVALAPGMRDDIISSGVREDKVSLIPNGCDIDLFKVSPEVGRKLRSANRWLGKRPMVLFTGTLGFVNGLDYLVELASETDKINPEICFALVGKGKEESKIKEMAQKQGVLDKNFFMIGQLPKAQMPAWLSASDLVIALFKGPRVIWKDATQNKFFDALAAGRPVAGNFNGWQTQVSIENDCGFMLDPENPTLAAKGIVEKLSDSIWLNKARQNASQLAESKFNRNDHAHNLEKILKDQSNFK